MLYPVMTERQLALKWNVSLKTLQRWRQAGEGPSWHKLFRYVRYHEKDVCDFEQKSSKNLLAILASRECAQRIKTNFRENPISDLQEQEARKRLVNFKEAVAATGLPSYLLLSRFERESKGIPYLRMVRCLRFSLEAILEWELANSQPGGRFR